MELYENNFNFLTLKVSKMGHTLALGMRLFLSTLSQKLKMHNVPELWHCHTLYICSSSVFFRLSLSNFDGLTSSALSIWRTRAWWCKSIVLALLVTIHHMKYSWERPCPVLRLYVPLHGTNVPSSSIRSNFGPPPWSSASGASVAFWVGGCCYRYRIWVF